MTSPRPAIVQLATPLLKWAGGKRWLLPVVAEPIRDRLDETGGRLVEPFFGGGAVGLHVSTMRGQPVPMIVGDVIEDLVNFYRVVRDEPALLAWAASGLVMRGVDKDAYLATRAEYNGLAPLSALIDRSAQTDPIRRAAYFFYLMRLCFNGVHRVNKAGDFNVPFGDKQPYRESVIKRRSRDAISSLFPHKGKIEAVARALSRAEIVCADFAVAVQSAGAGDVVFADPPYDGTYDGYAGKGFSPDDRARLAAELRAARGRGATVLACDADTEMVRDLYSSWCDVIQTAERRAVNSDGGGRGRQACLLLVASP